jgi:UTP--glucose-1-phosphate uridylyltransferase
MKVRKAVILAGGKGTRFLPLTKSQPKEMLPLVDKPLMQVAVEEAVSSGMDQVIIVIADDKRAIREYFEPSPELERFLEQKEDIERLQQIRDLAGLADISYVVQEKPYGLGHAVMTARDLVGREPFAVILPDDIIDSEIPGLKQMADVFEEYNASVLAVTPVNYESTKDYGIIDPENVADGLYRVLSLVEKPLPQAATSNLGIVGRYILTPEIFEAIENTPVGRGREIQLTDAIQLLLAHQPVYACELKGIRYDTGTPLGWLKLVMAAAVKRDDIGPEIKQFLKYLLEGSEKH